MPTIGWASLMLPVEPLKLASPKAKIPPSVAASQYPAPVRVAVMPTIGWASLMLPVEPLKVASPKAKIPPSLATSQYPLPVGVVVMPTIGLASLMLPVEPLNCASPKAKIPPSDATIQYPEPPAGPGPGLGPQPETQPPWVFQNGAPAQLAGVVPGERSFTKMSATPSGDCWPPSTRLWASDGNAT